MATTILSAEKDPMGAAISDYFNHHSADRLWVFSSQFEEDEIPVKELFRSIGIDCILRNSSLTDFGCRCRKWLPCAGTSGNGKRRMRH